MDPVYLPRIKQYSYKKLKIDLLEVNGFRVGGICEGEVKRKELSFSCLFHADFNTFGDGFLEELLSLKESIPAISKNPNN